MHIAELLKLASENGGAAFVIGLVVFVGVYYFIKLVKLVVAKIESSSDVISTLGKSLTNEKGEPINQVEHFNQVSDYLRDLKQISINHNEEAKLHYQHTKTLADENKVKNCEAQNCPYLIKMIAEVRSFTEKFDSFEEKARDSRVATGASLEEIRSQMVVLASEVSAQSKQMVGVLSDILTGRKK
jgi:hypothetical protein